MQGFRRSRSVACFSRRGHRFESDGALLRIACNGRFVPDVLGAVPGRIGPRAADHAQVLAKRGLGYARTRTLSRVATDLLPAVSVAVTVSCRRPGRTRCLGMRSGVRPLGAAALDHAEDLPFPPDRDAHRCRFGEGEGQLPSPAGP